MFSNPINITSLVSQPVLAIIGADTALANSTLDFIKNMGFTDGFGNDLGEPKTLSFEYEIEDSDSNSLKTVTIKKYSIPILTILSVPNIRIESSSVSYSINVNNIKTSTVDNINYIKAYGYLGNNCGTEVSDKGEMGSTFSVKMSLITEEPKSGFNTLISALTTILKEEEDSSYIAIPNSRIDVRKVPSGNQLFSSDETKRNCFIRYHQNSKYLLQVYRQNPSSFIGNELDSSSKLLIQNPFDTFNLNESVLIKNSVGDIKKGFIKYKNYIHKYKININNTNNDLKSLLENCKIIQTIDNNQIIGVINFVIIAGQLDEETPGAYIYINILKSNDINNVFLINWEDKDNLVENLNDNSSIEFLFSDGTRLEINNTNIAEINFESQWYSMFSYDPISINRDRYRLTTYGVYNYLEDDDFSVFDNGEKAINIKYNNIDVNNIWWPNTYEDRKEIFSQFIKLKIAGTSSIVVKYKNIVKTIINNEIFKPVLKFNFNSTAIINNIEVIRVLIQDSSQKTLFNIYLPYKESKVNILEQYIPYNLRGSSNRTYTNNYSLGSIMPTTPLGIEVPSERNRSNFITLFYETKIKPIFIKYHEKLFDDEAGKYVRTMIDSEHINVIDQEDSGYYFEINARKYMFELNTRKNGPWIEIIKDKDSNNEWTAAGFKYSDEAKSSESLIQIFDREKDTLLFNNIDDMATYGIKGINKESVDNDEIQSADILLDSINKQRRQLIKGKNITLFSSDRSRRPETFKIVNYYPNTVQVELDSSPTFDAIEYIIWEDQNLFEIDGKSVSIPMENIYLLTNKSNLSVNSNLNNWENSLNNINWELSAQNTNNDTDYSGKLFNPDNHAINTGIINETCSNTAYQLPNSDILGNNDLSIEVHFYNVNNVRLLQMEILDKEVGSNINTISQKSNNLLVR